MMLARSAPTQSEAQLIRFNRLDFQLQELARNFGANEFKFPVLISKANLECAEYDQAFPHLLCAMATVSDPGRESFKGARLLHQGNIELSPWCLSPAVCYHVYSHFRDSTLSKPLVITALGHCFRNEAELVPEKRQIEFQMREIVFLGPQAWVLELQKEAKSKTSEVFASLQIHGTWVGAEDPFFLPAAQGKAMMQKLLETKLEFQTPAPESLAVASINYHASFFGERFNINVEGEVIHSACLAFGLDRLVHCRTRVDKDE